MNDIIRAMEERRSIRSFKETMPPKEDIEQIIEAGLYAASGRGEQATITLAVTNNKIREMLSESNRLIGGWKKGVEYTLPHSDALKGVSGYTVDDLYVVGPVYYTIRSHTAAGQNWHQDSNGYFDISGGSLYVRMDGNALAGGKGVYIHSATDPKPIGYK